MKNILKILIAGIILLSSCSEDILDKQPLDIISDANVWNDQNLIDAYLTSTYEQTYILLNENPVASGQQWFQPFLVNEISDEATSRWVGQNGVKYGNLRIGGGLLEWWEQSYHVIRMLNEIIEKVPDSPTSDDFKVQRVAEARFLRAYNYFSMVKRYGGVPLITEPQELDDPEESLYPDRNSEKEVYDFVLSEMDAIGNDLPLSNSGVNLGRPTKYAALALKSRAALYAGSIARYGDVQMDGLLGINSSQAESYYQAAYDAADQIITDGVHSLYNADEDKVANFKNIFLVEDNPEVIWSRKHDYSDWNRGGNGWSWDFMQTPFPNAWTQGNQSTPYLDMIEEFEYIDGSSGQLDRTAVQQGLWTMEELWGNKDPRFFASIYTNQTPWKGETLDFHKGILLPDGTLQTDGSYEGILANGSQVKPNQYTTGFGIMKYLEEAKDNRGERATSGTDWIIFRYAEVLLNFAEASFELGLSSDALGAINDIRRRAGIAELGDVDLAAIQHERKVELFAEGHRYWDVRRWRTAVEELSGNWSGIQYILDVESGKYQIFIIENVHGTNNPPQFFDFNYYFPITLARTGQNPNLVENPGYE